MLFNVSQGAKLVLENALPINTQIDLFIGIMLTLHSNFIGYALIERLYSYTEIFMDNLSTDIQSFFSKKIFTIWKYFLYCFVINCNNFSVNYNISEKNISLIFEVVQF